MSKKKTGVIGAGWFGRAHCRVYNTISDLQSVCDTNEERAKMVADSYSINYYIDYLEMIKNEDLDAISVVLPPRMIPSVTEDFAKKGIDVLLEKVSEFKRGYLENGLTVEEYEEFGPVMHFRNMFIKSWKSTLNLIKEMRGK